MQTGAKLLTAPTPPNANYEPGNLQSSTISLVSSSLLFWQIERTLTQEEGHMDQPQPPATSRNRDDIWFSISPSARQVQEEIRGPDRLPVQATSSRARSERSVSPVPSISTPEISTGINKPLPPSPEPGKKGKSRKPLSLRSLVRRRPSNEEPEPDRTHLQPEPHHRQRSSSANATLSPDPNQNYRQHKSTRSVPNSPSYPPDDMTRSYAAPNYGYADPSYYQSYAPQSTYRSHRNHSIDADFEAQPPRARRTFPETPTSSNAPAQRQRPRTWLSPTEAGTEALHDPSEFHLFVQATSGLPDGAYSTFSPTTPNAHPQGSLFPRGRQNDRIPIPLQHSYSARPSTAQSYDISSWQTAPGYDSNEQPLVSSSALPSPARSHHSHHSHRSHHSSRSRASPNINAVNLELERLGLDDDEDRDDDELPNYQQSQAEMSERKRKEAASRARELEARWNRSRGRS